MGLFKKKKTDSGLKRNVMKRDSALPIFPKYVEEAEEAPLRRFPKPPSLPPLPKFIEPIEEEPEEELEYQAPEFEEFQAPIRKPLKPLLDEPMPLTRRLPEISVESKPIFVKLERYKAAIKTLDDLKEKIKEAEELLVELNQIKSEEDRELATWQRQISNIKTKLLEVDKNLFEV